MRGVRFHVPGGAVLLLLTAVGCGIHDEAATDVTRALEEWQRPRQRLVDGNAATRPADQGAALPGGPAGEEADGDLILREASAVRLYIREALEQNPSVKAAAANVEARLARIPQVTALSDPMFRAMVLPDPMPTLMGDEVLTLGVMQRFPLPAKLELAGSAAAAEVRMAIEQLNAVRLRVIADVERAYFRLYLAERSIELTRANHQVLEDLERVVDTQYRVGQVEQQDVLRIQTELSNLENDARRYRQQRQSAAAALNQLLNRPPHHDVPATEPIARDTVLGRVEELLTRAREHNPELAMLIHQEQRDRDNLEIANLGYWPDLEVGVDWRAFSGQGSRAITDMGKGDGSMVMLGFQLNIPLWTQRIEGQKREARRSLDRTLHEQRAMQNLVAFRIYDAWTDVEARQEVIALLETSIIPQARQTYEVSLGAYPAGRVDFLTVIENWRQMLTFELMLHREIAEMEMAFADLQREVGVELLRREWTKAPHDEELRP